MSNVRSDPQYRCDVIKDQTCHLPSPSHHALKHAIVVRKCSISWEREPPARSPPAPAHCPCCQQSIATLPQRFPPPAGAGFVLATAPPSPPRHSPRRCCPCAQLHANQFIRLCHQKGHRSGKVGARHAVPLPAPRDASFRCSIMQVAGCHNFYSTSDSPVVHPAVRPHGSEHLNDTLCQSRYDPMRRLAKSVVNLPRRTGCISRNNLLCSKWHEGVLPTACCAVNDHLNIDGPVRPLRIDISRQWARSNYYDPIHL
ncbi:MAG: hypothetical protein KatS3mg056_2779 [Chloroflexus sp.]|jgi:hypothetical protein|nr:MAG: hypothetical protein KatS3mg056_2779 [Chloroflexus sp.]